MKGPSAHDIKTLRSRAIYRWRLDTEGICTIAMAAKAFNLHPLEVVEAAEFHPQLFLDGSKVVNLDITQAAIEILKEVKE